MKKTLSAVALLGALAVGCSSPAYESPALTEADQCYSTIDGWTIDMVAQGAEGSDYLFQVVVTNATLADQELGYIISNLYGDKVNLLYNPNGEDVTQADYRFDIEAAEQWCSTPEGQDIVESVAASL